jgi:hypothetical protein
MAKWFDLGDERFKLRFIRDPKTKHAVLFIVGVEKDSPTWNACLEKPLSFRAGPTGKPILIKQFTARDALTPEALRVAFPKARLIEVPDIRVFELIDGSNGASPQEAALAAAMRQATLIGLNALSQRVFESPAGERFVLTEQGGRIEEAKVPGAMVLRANGQNDRQCAQGFVMGLMAGAHAEADDVVRFTGTLFGREASANPERVAYVGRLIEAEMAARLIDRHKLAGINAYLDAQVLYENAPGHVGEPKGAGATPLPVTVIAQELVRAYGNDDRQNLVYAPSLYDGALVSILGSAYPVMSEPVLADSREAQIRTLVPPHINVFERALGEPVAPHRISILNVEDDSAETIEDIVGRLAKRDRQGLSVILIPSETATMDRNMADPSPVATERLARTLAHDYDMLGFVQIAPIMRRKMGLVRESWLNMLVVGRKFGRAEIEAREANAELHAPVLDRMRKRVFDWDALRSTANDILADVHKAAGHALTAAEKAALEIKGDENRFQLPYQPFSKNGQPEMMVPRNLAGATYEALQRLTDRVGSIDEYVRNAIGFDEEQFKYPAPEQIDAAALAVERLDAGKGFLLGDQTGAGKGATLAMTMGWAFKRNIPVIFVTKQPSLFSDFYRDIKRCGMAEKLRPMVLNYNTDVVDQFSEGLDVVAKGVPREHFIENYRFGLEKFGNPNVIFTTYSQFNRGEEAEKADWAIATAKNALVIFDEAHIAAGDASNLGRVCQQMAQNAIGVVYSSATSIKDARQVTFYSRCLPESISAQEVAVAIEAGGENLSETLAVSLARDGAMIRRERDSSKIEIAAIVDEKNLKRNEDIANRVSKILQAIQRLCGVTEQVGRRLTKDQVAKLDAARVHMENVINRTRGEMRERAQARRAGEDVDVEDDDLDQELVANNREFELTTFEEDVNQRVALEHQPEAAPEGEAITHLVGAAPEQEAISNRATVFTLPDFGFSADERSRIEADLRAADEDSGAFDRVKKDLRNLTRMQAAIQTRTASFGGLLFFTRRMLNVSLSAVFAGERAVEHIRAGRKPVIFLEQTFEAALNGYLDEPEAVKNEDGTFTIKPMTLKDNLRAMYKTIDRMTHINPDGEEMRGTVMDAAFNASEGEKEAVRDGLQVLNDMIEELPDTLFCSPVDTIKHAIRAAGFTVAEATGRKYEVLEMEQDKWTVGLRKKKDKKISNIERAFNFGDADALVGNKAMSTGMSLHASADFSDQRQRVTIFCQLFQDINDYMQSMGRTDRKGQTQHPLMEMLASGLPSEARIMMVHYAKLRKQLAATTGDRANRFEAVDAVDLFNNLGDQSVRDFLQSNPGIAVRLGIPFGAYMPTAISAEGREIEPNYHELAKQTSSLLDLLMTHESRQVFEEMAHNFNEVVKEYDRLGVNPLKTNVVDFTQEDVAVISGREDLMPARVDDEGEVKTVFDEAVELVTVSYQSKIRAPKWNEIHDRIQRSNQVLLTEGRERRGNAQDARPDFIGSNDQVSLYMPPETENDVLPPLPPVRRLLPTGLRERVQKMFEVHQIMMRSSAEARALMGDAVPEAAPGPGATRPAVANPNRVAPSESRSEPIRPDQVLERRLTWLMQSLEHLVPGSFVSFQRPGWFSEAGKIHQGVVTSLRVPERGRETNFSRWGVTIQVPGYRAEHDFTLKDLYKANFRGLNEWLPGIREVQNSLLSEDVSDMFDSYHERNIQGKEHVLMGNLFRAANLAAGEKIGAGGVLQLRNEPPTRIISLNSNLTKDAILERVPIELPPETAMALFRTTWRFLDQPAPSMLEDWKWFFKLSLESRGLHNAKKTVDATLSWYWMGAAKSGFDFEESERGESDEAAARDGHLISGFGIRLRSIEEAKIIEVRDHINQLFDELGAPHVTVHSRRGASSARLICRFRNAEGTRDSEEVIDHKMRIMCEASATLFPKMRFYTASSRMRLLAMAITEERRREAQTVRAAREQAEAMRATVARMHFEDRDESLVDGAALEPAVDEITFPPDEETDVDRLAA